MQWKKLVSVALFTATAAAMSAGAQAADKVRIGYWSSGVSMGFGAVLEATPFMKQQNLDVQYIRFPDVNAPLRALASNSIDLAYGAPAAGVFSSVAGGVPLKVFAATQPADVQFVAPEGSPIKSLDQLRGKKVGMSPSGSSVAAIAGAILAGNYGIKPDDFSLVGGNESRLAQFLVQKQVDAAALRSVTVAQLNDLKVRPLGSFADEWAKLTKTDSVPYIGIGAVSAGFVQAHPDVVARAIAGMRNALVWAESHQPEVIDILKKSANLPEDDAKVYAGLWKHMYRISFEPADIDTLKREHQVFADTGLVKGNIKDDLFVTGPWQQSKTIK
jgi:NitT/TauT family transport system substrate-binding protein